jgi:MSHA biogenesis protein MshE
MTGHLVLSTLHTNDAVSTPVRLLDMGVPPFMVASSLQAVIAQRLVRLICESCAEPYQPTSAEREWLRAELRDTVDQRRYIHGKGCSHCNGMGYLGRGGVYEMLEMTNEVSEAANHKDPTHFMKVAAAQMGGHTLRRHAVSLVVAGKTTIAEAMRISNQLDE